MKKIVFSEEQLRDIFAKYQNEHISMAKIGEKYNVSKTVISRILKENNIPIKKDNHKYYADYRKFSSIDSVEKAYWLGFLAADGYVFVREENATIGINLSRKDKSHLEKFKTFMNSNVNIIDHIQTQGFSNNSEMSRITFNSKDMANDLIKVGIVPRKSLILQPPIIDEQFYLPFILGYFDGDGSIFSTTQGSYGINIVGTKEILEWINNILDITTKFEKRDNDSKNNYYIRCGGINKPYLILKQLYDSSPVFLERKYEKFLELEKVVLNRNIK